MIEQDADLIKRAATDESAFAEIYQRHYRYVFCLCNSILKDEFLAEDLTQDVFICLYKKLTDFRGESKFTTWLHRVTVNQCLMYKRKRVVKFERTTDTGELPELDENISRSAVVDRIAIDEAVKKLAKGYRKVFYLRSLGYDHNEIAQILGVHEGTSKSQYCKAKSRMRKILKTRFAQTI